MAKYKSSDERVSDKIKKLLKEGKPRKQAVAQGINMTKRKKKGKY
jgi:hypothetical protein|tara:strand:- start:5844 stop:5978 length:135 start_codon:yes stop_codon:yes gene_type:complete